MNKKDLEDYKDSMEITVGHDVEVFLKDSEGTPISSIGKVGGSKEEPLQTQHGWVQEDGVAAEVNILPATSCTDFVESTILVLNDLLSIIKPLDLELKIDASAIFDESQLKDPLALLAGCDEDYNAYSMTVNDSPEYTSGLRGAGGHIHVGWKGGGETLKDIVEVVKAIEYNIVLPSILLDDDKSRRELYGAAGAHRPKPYGVEVRSPSNFWVKSTEYMEWVYYSVINSVKMRGNLPIKDGDLRSIIDNYDRAGAFDVIKSFNISLPRGVTLDAV